MTVDSRCAQEHNCTRAACHGTAGVHSQHPKKKPKVFASVAQLAELQSIGRRGDSTDVVALVSVLSPVVKVSCVRSMITDDRSAKVWARCSPTPR